MLRPLALGVCKRQRPAGSSGVGMLLLRPSLLPHQIQASRWLSAGGASLRLNNIRDNPAASRSSKRVGRGIGSGKGKTSGRGHKGLKQRRGNSGLSLHEGGQMPLQRRVPKSGFTNNHFKENLQRLNVGALQDWIDAGRLDPSVPITLKHLHDARVVGRVSEGIKLLGEGCDRLTTPVHIEVSRASATAIEAVERAGGRIVCTWRNRLALRAHLKPEKFLERGRPLPRSARPPPKKMDYYTDHANRGYLSPELQIALQVEKLGLEE